MGQILLLVGIPLVVVAGVILALVTSTRDASARRRFLEEHGFTSCSPEKPDLEARVRALLGDRHTHIQVLRPCLRRRSGPAVYFFTLHQYRTNVDARAARVFLLTLPRRTDQPCTLFLKPTGLREGWVTRGLRALLTLRAGIQADGLAPLELPPDPEVENLLGAWGPRGAAIRDLIDRDLLRLLVEAGNAGFLTVRCLGSDCLLEHPASLAWDHDRAWAFIARLDQFALTRTNQDLAAAG